MKRRGLFAALLCGTLAGTGAAEPPPPVGDFALLDERGRFHRLYDHAGARAVVLFVQGNGCPIARGAIPVLNALRAELEPRGVAFLALNASPQDARAAVAAEADAFGLEVPVLLDEAQLVAASLDLSRTAEALVVDPAGWRLLYRGPLDDSLDYEAKRPARRAYAREVLLAHLGGERIPFERRAAPGCLLLLPRDGPRPVSYAEDAAPILLRRCATCHRAGGAAPFAMRDYAMVRGWAPMMRESILTLRMPPWHADPHVGRFANDVSLTREEARALVRWIEAGAPRGDGPDPLAEARAEPPPAWPLGEPDLVVAAPRQAIPAAGVLPYRYETIELPLQKDVWLRAADVRPTNLLATHHATATIVYPEGREPERLEGPHFARGLLAGYVPGREPEPFPEGTGFLLPAGARIRFQLHYGTTGKEEVDEPRLGLYFGRGRPRHELRIGAAASTTFEIPPGTPDHEEVAERTLSRDVVIYRLTPHMHYRGRRMAIEAHYPDGRSELLLSVPNYRFPWQRQYVLAEPRLLPAGTRVVARAGFDNSARNPANPDPTVAVRFGEQSFEEMLIGYFLYREAGPGERPRAAP
jgi:mono/diheme cytochrome c family protein